VKLISLNTWGGAAGLKGLADFFEKYKEADIFCLQEVWNGGEHMRGIMAGGRPLENFIPKLYGEISNILNSHNGYFCPHFHEWYGLAMFVRKSAGIMQKGEVFVYKDKGYIAGGDAGNHSRNIQYVTIETPAGARTIINFHGLWNGRGKTDSDDRLLQSKNIARFLRNLRNPHILCGDFNLLPETQSLKVLENLGMRNLIKEFGIASTRSSLYLKPHRFADYALVSDGIKVNEFKVLPDEVSDHLALYLNFK
jgi:exonuclease III